MGRTTKDIKIVGRNAEEVRSLVQRWFAENKVDVIENRPELIKGRWGIGLATAPKYFQVAFLPTQDGIIAHTEGWITLYGVKDQDFSPSALAGGIPRREGWRHMERLWGALQAFSQSQPIPAKFCSNCGESLTDEKSKFCSNCGKAVD